MLIRVDRVGLFALWSQAMNKHSGILRKQLNRSLENMRTSCNRREQNGTPLGPRSTRLVKCLKDMGDKNQRR